MMNHEALIQTRHAFWANRLAEYNRRANAKVPQETMASWDTLAEKAAAIIGELEHLADALGIELDQEKRLSRPDW